MISSPDDTTEKMSTLPSLLSRILRNLRNSIGFSQKTMVGEDHLGNKYFEKLADEKRNRRGSRYFQTLDGRYDSDVTVPTEWKAWLQFKRDKPPTAEEIEKNYMYMMRTQHRAMELETKQLAEKESQQSDKKLITSDLSSSAVSEKKKFPEFEDLEVGAGVPKDKDFNDEKS